MEVIPNIDFLLLLNVALARLGQLPGDSKDFLEH
jgi:hypothetical protein